MITAKSRTPRASLIKRKVYYIDNSIVEKVISKVAVIFNLLPIQVTKIGRYRDNVLARNMCYYILHVHYKQTSSQIAPYFKRDRTTILHGINTFVNDVEVMPNYFEKYLALRSNIKIPKLYSQK